MKFALLVPLKVSSDGLDDTCSEVERLLQSALKFQNSKHCVCVVFGVDLGDNVLDTEKGRAALLDVAESMRVADVEIVTLKRTTPVGICALWNRMCRHAYNEMAADFFILLGDDVRITSTGDWMADVVHAFEQLPTMCIDGTQRHDFGCVALNDVTNVGFPSFPVVGRTHVQMFGGDVVPVPPFVNQDGDPFLFALYRRWAAATFVKSVTLTNAIGGAVIDGDETAKQPRYERVHIDWRGAVLRDAIARVAAALGDEQSTQHERLVIDVVTPSYRVDLSFLRGIVEQSVPRNCSTMFIIAVDDPSADLTQLRQLEASVPGRMRVRQHARNGGASAARNTGLAESDADWVIFLDDDVIPEQGLIAAYADAIEKHGDEFDGFVGVTELPFEPRVFAHAVHMSDVSFFWRIAEHMETLPWGVTANIAVRRSPDAAFDVDFIKTGGGEDIDYCLQLPRWPLRAVPSARVLHPWWHGGARCYGHFFRWAFGDSLLLDKHPQHTYWSFPNCIEVLLLAPLLAFVARRHALWCCATWIVSVLVIDVCCDLLRNCVRDRLERLPARGLLRVLASVEGTAVKWSTDVGHFVGPLRRGAFSHTCHRFDWFCGLLPHVIGEEKKRQFFRFILFILSFCCCLNHFS